MSNREQYEQDWHKRLQGKDGGQFAMAIAILELADALHRLGVNDAFTKMGAIELLVARSKGLKEPWAIAIIKDNA